MKRIILVFLVGVLIAGCSQISNVDPSNQLSLKKDEAILVLGISPRMRYGIMTGDIDEGQWSCGFWRNVAAHLWSEDGFIVIKLKTLPENERYAFYEIQPRGYTVFKVFSGDWNVRKGYPTPTFNLKPGVVNFAGAVKVVRENYKYHFKPDPSVTLEDAKTFLSKKYPHFPKEVVESPLKMMKAAHHCLV